ncbi:MAG TPA: tRNA (adenosine(37)-N6)-threonylcarbamoyltransferase complex dimerization subunit type 1 TsaB, partial [Candidatus Saccharimonadales bacterium]
MTYLGLRTDAPEVEFWLYRDGAQPIIHHWQADRQLAHGLLGQLETFLHTNDMAFDRLDGLFVYQGPGSFTGLRIGISVMNTLAYGLGVPVVGVQGDTWGNAA